MNLQLGSAVLDHDGGQSDRRRAFAARAVVAWRFCDGFSHRRAAANTSGFPRAQALPHVLSAYAPQAGLSLVLQALGTRY
jgi:hypothetical protein